MFSTVIASLKSKIDRGSCVVDNICGGTEPTESDFNPEWLWGVKGWGGQGSPFFILARSPMITDILFYIS